MPNIFGNNNVAPPGVPIPPGPMGPQGPQGPPGPTAIQEEGIALPARNFLNFVGTGVSASDDAAHNRVTVTVTGGGGGATPGGPVTSIQVNDAGALAGYPSLTYDGRTLQGQQLAYVSNPPEGTDPNSKRAWDLLVYSDNTNVSAQFSQTSGCYVDHRVTGGYYNYDDTPAIGTFAKSTTVSGYFGLTCSGASQAFALAVHVDKWSMGDCGAVNGIVTYRGGPLSGDEGQCYQCFTYLRQDSVIVTTTITAVKRATCPANMTVTQAVVASKDPQTVNVSSTAGLVANDYLVAGQSSNTGPQHIRHVQVISVTPTTLTAVIAVNMSSGDSLKPALVLTVQDGPGRFGQLIPIVNLSGATVSTGTVASITANAGTFVGEFNGSGTAWATNMVGGDALNIGAVSLVNDNDTITPFDATPPESGGHMLRSWYQVMYVTGAGLLGINSYSVTGARYYRGNGVGAGGYLIKPCARALWFPPSTYDVVCEYSPHVWNVGDRIESTICPYPDSVLQYWNMSAYTPGGSYRGGIVIMNGGHRTIDTCFSATSNLSAGSHDAPWGWGAGLQCEGCHVGVTIGSITPTRDAAIGIWNAPHTPPYNANIIWHGDGSGYSEASIGTSGSHFEPGRLAIAESARLDWCSTAFTGEFFGEIRLGGNLTIYPPDDTNIVFMQITKDLGPLAGPARARSLLGWRIEATLGIADANLYFHYINDSDGTSLRPFSITRPYTTNFAGPTLAKRGIATSGGNFGSFEAVFETSIWDGSAAQTQYSMMRSEVASGHNTLSVYIVGTGESVLTPSRALSITDVGKLILGPRGGPFVSGYGSVTLDPTGVTAPRTLTLPDASGILGFQSPTSTFLVFPTETVPPGTTSNGFIQTLGYSFQVTKPLLVSALGRPYLAANTQDHFIGLWNGDTHTLLASGTILNATASDGHGFKNVAVTPVLLVPGVNYTLGTTEHAGGDFHKDEFSLAGLVSSAIIPGTSMYTGGGAADTEPTNSGAAPAAFVGPGMTFTDALATGQATFDPSHLTAPRTITIPDSSGTMVLTPLPSSSPGSGKLWYDPADSNRVKYTP